MISEIDILEELKKLRVETLRNTEEIKALRQYVESKKDTKLGFPRHWDLRTSEDKK